MQLCAIGRTTSMTPCETPRAPLQGKALAVLETIVWVAAEDTETVWTSPSAVLFFLQYILRTLILIQLWLMPVCSSSSQMGLTAPPGTYRTLQGRLYGGRCCLGKDLVQACAESMYFSGSLYWQNNYSGQSVIYNCPPATGFLREDVGTNIHTHSSSISV